MVLDEFAGLKRMEVIETAAAQIAGYGVKLFFVLQSLEQLKAVYKDNWETFLANSGLKLFFNLEDNFSRDYVSKLIGETEVIREVRSESDSTSESESTSRSVSRSESARALVVDRDFGKRGHQQFGVVGHVRGDQLVADQGKTYNDGRSWTPTSLFAGGCFGTRTILQKNDSRSWSIRSARAARRAGTRGARTGFRTARRGRRPTALRRTTGTSETEGTTRGTSQSRTAGIERNHPEARAGHAR